MTRTKKTTKKLTDQEQKDKDTILDITIAKKEDGSDVKIVDLPRDKQAIALEYEGMKLRQRRQKNFKKKLSVVGSESEARKLIIQRGEEAEL